MSLLSNKIVYYIILTLVIFIVQVNFPYILFYNNYRMTLDLILVYITIVGLLNGSYKLIFYAFVYGIIQDIVFSTSQLGLLSFISSLTAFFLISIKNYNNLWSTKMKYIVVFLIYLFHFVFYYSILYSDVFGVIFLISFFQAVFTFLLFFLVSNFIIKIK
tara:strand:+ start:1211 stop:1690 length:480 start_codon:yes stop_codon:yes gene_type:complete